MRTAALLNKADMCNPKEILDFDALNIKMDGTNKAEEAIAKMVLMCEHREHFAAINHLVNHIDELHDSLPHHMKWIVCHALATMKPEDKTFLTVKLRKTLSF